MTCRETEPVPYVLHCPKCKQQHIDLGEWATTRHHRWHQCAHCDTEWCPYDYNTIGVEMTDKTTAKTGTFITADPKELLKQIEASMEELNRADNKTTWILVDPYGKVYAGTPQEMFQVLIPHHPLFQPVGVQRKFAYPIGEAGDPGVSGPVCDPGGEKNGPL